MITFKVLANSDIKNIVVMMQQFYAIDNYPIDTAVSKDLLLKFIADKTLGKAWLILKHDENKLAETIGYVILTFLFSFENKGRIAFLDELYIDAKFRGQGYGNKTIQFIKDESLKLKLKMLYLEVENHNQNAQTLYLSNNFEFHHRKLMKFKI